MPKQRTYYSANDTPHVRKIRNKYGVDIFVKWGRKGGNPLLLKVAAQKRRQQLHNR